MKRLFRRFVAPTLGALLLAGCSVGPQYVGPPKTPTPDRKQQNIRQGLYEVVVKVYRNFSDVEDSRLNQPITELIAYVAAR